MPETAAHAKLESVSLGAFLLMLASVSLSVAVSQICLGVVLLILLYRGVVQRHWPRRNGVEMPALALAIWALGMIPLATDVSQAALFYRRFFLFTALWAGSSLATDDRRRGLMLAAIVFGGFVASLYGEYKLIQAAGGLFGRRLLTASNAMTSGAMLMMVVLVAIGWLSRGFGNSKARLFVLLGALPVAFALLQTMTRSALLGLLAGVGVMVLLVRPRWFLVFAVVLSVLLGVVYVAGDAVVPDGFWRRISPEALVSSKNTNHRLEMWRGGWEMVKAHPLTGVGDCDLEKVAPAYYGDAETTYYGHLHSNPIQLAAIWGLPGFVLAQIFIFAPLILMWRRWRALTDRSGERAGWLVAGVGVWAAFLVAGLTEWYFGDAEPMMLYLAILGIALGGEDGQAAGNRVTQQPKES